jgi:AraC-like DNA-binding protein
MPAFYEQQPLPVKFFFFHNICANAHLHKEVEFLYVKEGSIRIALQGEQHILHEGDLLMVFPNKVHQYVTDESSESVTLVFDAELAADFVTKLQRYQCKWPILTAEQVHPDVRYCLEAMPRAVNESKMSIAKGFLAVLVGRVLEQLTLQKVQLNSAEPAMQRMLVYISEHFTESLTIGQVAEAIGANRQHLSRLFSGKVQVGFNDYVNSLRVGLAQQLLGHPRISIQEVAAQCGFDSQRTFNRAFKSLAGMTPTAYRKQLVSEKT